MDFFQYQNGELYAEQVPVADIIQQYGSPVYIYSKATLERHWHAFDKAFENRPHLICYAVKANSNIGVLQVLAQLGSGFDVVSIGEIKRALKAGAEPSKIVFSGLGKQEHEIEEALKLGIGCFNVESAPELKRIEIIANALEIKAPISIRVNPNVNANTHPYISTGLKENKFGVDEATAMTLYHQANRSNWLNPIGIDCHIGSQLTELDPFIESLDILLRMITTLRQDGISLRHLDLGGGLGVPYQDETPPHPKEFALAVAQRLDEFSGPELTIILEPGRAIAANAGILATTVEFLKPTVDRNFIVVDAAMNDLIRPSLYQAWQNIIPVKEAPPQNQSLQSQSWDIVGPVCESGDYLGKDRKLSVQAGDYLAVRSAGAYGFCMSSNYNSRNRVAEVLVDQDQTHLVRRRETLDDQMSLESLITKRSP